MGLIHEEIKHPNYHDIELDVVQKEKGELERLTPESRYVVDYFIKNKIQRRSFRTLDPRYNEQMIGLESAIDAGYLRITTHPLDKTKTFVKPTNKLLDLYF